MPRIGVMKDNSPRYRASKHDCDLCPLKPHCCPNAPARKISCSIYEGARDLARDIAKAEGYQTSRDQRKKVEMLFAHLKRILKLDRLRLRGPCGARDEFHLAATPIVLVNNFKPATRTFRYPVDMVKSIRQIWDRSAAPRGAQVIPGMTKIQLGDRDELSVQIRDYDPCFAEFLKPSGNGQKILQAILLREAFRLFARQGVAIKQNAPTVILDVSCGPGDYSVAWTSQIARFLPKGIAFYCTDYPDGIARETGETYAMTTAKKMREAAENGKLRLAQPPVATDADLFSGHDGPMPPAKWPTSSIGRTADTMCATRSAPPGMILGGSKWVCIELSISCGQRLTKWV
jgi:hypothetical protein